MGKDLLQKAGLYLLTYYYQRHPIEKIHSPQKKFKILNKKDLKLVMKQLASKKNKV